MRYRLFEIIETAKENDRLSNIYDIIMMVVIIASLVPLAFKSDYFIFDIIDIIATFFFIIDYIMRIVTADYKLKHGAFSFFIYPFTPMAIIDMFCILPSLTLVGDGFRILKIIRLLRTLRVLRVFKAVRYSKSLRIIKGVLKNQKKPLLTVGFIAVAYIIVSALIVFNVEPDSFNNFYDAIYWATVSLTTMGYGDIYPVTTIGRFVTMVSSVFGIAVIALPSGIITAGFLEELTKDNESDDDNKD